MLNSMQLLNYNLTETKKIVSGWEMLAFSYLKTYPSLSVLLIVVLVPILFLDKPFTENLKVKRG